LGGWSSENSHPEDLRLLCLPNRTGQRHKLQSHSRVLLKGKVKAPLKKECWALAGGKCWSLFKGQLISCKGKWWENSGWSLQEELGWLTRSSIACMGCDHYS
jgi:hypothetical protein